MGPSVGGQRPRDNNFTVEGVDNNNKSVTGALIVGPERRRRELHPAAEPVQSEFGHSSGGQFNTTIKSGTNGFHGSLYEYFRNRNLNAVDTTFVHAGLDLESALRQQPLRRHFRRADNQEQVVLLYQLRAPAGRTYRCGSGAPVSTPTAAGLAAIAADPGLSATNFGIFKQYVPVAAAAGGLHSVHRASSERSIVTA